MNKMYYTIVRHTSEELDVAVNNYLSEGYELHGGVSVAYCVGKISGGNDTKFAQAVVKIVG